MINVDSGYGSEDQIGRYDWVIARQELPTETQVRERSRNGTPPRTLGRSVPIHDTFTCSIQCIYSCVYCVS